MVKIVVASDAGSKVSLSLLIYQSTDSSIDVSREIVDVLVADKNAIIVFTRRPDPSKNSTKSQTLTYFKEQLGKEIYTQSMGKVRFLSSDCKQS